MLPYFCSISSRLGNVAASDMSAGIGAVHAADERLGEPVEDLSAHAAHDEALERLVVELAGGELLLGDEEVHARAHLARPREQAGRRERHELGRREHHHAVGHLVEPAAREDQRLLARLVGRHRVAADPDLSLAMRLTAGLAVRNESGPPSTMNVPCSLVDDLAVDLAAETVVLLDAGRSRRPRPPPQRA